MDDELTSESCVDKVNVERGEFREAPEKLVDAERIFFGSKDNAEKFVAEAESCHGEHYNYRSTLKKHGAQFVKMVPEGHEGRRLGGWKVKRLRG